MKTPEEIKKGLECYAGKCEGNVCNECQRSVYTLHELFTNKPTKDALAYIQQLETNYSQVSKALCGKENAAPDELLQAVDQLKSRLAQAERERDAALYDLREADQYECTHCKNNGTTDDACEDLNQFMQEVHKNAVSHGWWDDERSPGTIRALIHAELSEALEAYRNHETLVWHKCPVDHKPCEYQPMHDMPTLPCGAYDPASRKPEGVAVELMDFVIRIFDYLAKIDWQLPASTSTAQKLADWALDDYQDDRGRDVLNLDLPDLVDLLHDEVSLSSVMHNETYLTTAAGLAMAWVEKNSVDPVELLLEKHEYNKTRPYKHGGKVC